MLAFAFQEFVSRVPVVEETPAVFGLTPGEEEVEREVATTIINDFNAIEYFLHRLHLI